MKTKILLILAVIGMTMGLASCASKEEKATEKYMEACADGNFDEARAIVEKLAAQAGDDYIDINEHMKYVNDKEIYYLLAHANSENNNRIMYLFNSYDSYQLPDMDDVIEVAISMDNEQLASKLIKAGVEPTEAIAKAAISADMNDLVMIIIKKNPHVVFEKEVAEYYATEEGTDKLKSLLLSLWELDESEDVHSNIIKLGNSFGIDGFEELAKKETVRKLNEALSEIRSMTIPNRPALGVVKSDHYGELSDEYKEYNEAVANRNNACTELIGTAMELGERSVANQALNLMKPSLQCVVIGDWCRVVEHKNDHSSVYNAFRVTEDRSAIEDARKLIK